MKNIIVSEKLGKEIPLILKAKINNLLVVCVRHPSLPPKFDKPIVDFGNNFNRLMPVCALSLQYQGSGEEIFI